MAIDWENVSKKAKQMDRARYEQIRKPAATKTVASSKPLALPTAQNNGGAQMGSSTALSGSKSLPALGLPTGRELGLASLKTSPAQTLQQRQALAQANKQQQERAAFDAKYGDDSRLELGVKSILTSTAAALPVIGETTAQAAKNLATDLGNKDYQKKLSEMRGLSGLLEGLGENDPQYAAKKAEYDALLADMEGMKTKTALNPNSTGMKMMREANQLRTAATEGMSGTGKFLADTAIGIGQNALLLPTAVINPAIPLVAMGAQSGAQKMYEVQEAGGSAGEALARGAVAGGIEAVTEKIPLDTLLDVAKTGGKSAIKNVLKQAGIEAGEETVSYLANLGADRFAGDDVQFSGKDLALSALGGAISGGVMSGGATALNRGGQAAKGLWTAEETPARMAELTAGQGSVTTEAKGLPTGQEAAERQKKAAYAAETGEVDLLEDQDPLSIVYGQSVDRENAMTVLRHDPVVPKEGTEIGWIKGGGGRDFLQAPVTEEQISANRSMLGSESAVVRLTGKEFPDNGVSLVERVAEFFHRAYKNRVPNREIGYVDLTRRGVKDSTRHGMSDAKGIGFAAVPEVIKYGLVIDTDSNHSGRGYDTYTLAAPVEVRQADGSYERQYVGAIVKRDGNSQRYYLHEVLTQKELASRISTGAADNSGKPGGPQALYTKRLLQSAVGVNSQGMENAGKDTPIPNSEKSVKPEHMTDWEWERWQENAARSQNVQTARWGTDATDKLGMEDVSSPITTLGAAQSLRGLEKGKYEAKKNLDRLLKQAQIPKPAQQFAKEISEGIYTVEQAARLGMDPKVMQEVADAYTVLNSFNDKAIQSKKAQYTAAFDVRTQELIKNSDKATPPSILSLNANTMQRNNERTWGKDAAAINAEYFDPIVENEAKRIRFVNNQLSKMEGYRLTADESAQVQRLMEEKVTESDLRVRGYDVDKLRAAAKTLSQMYGDFYDAINDFLVAHGYKEIGWQKNYAPHMQEEQVGQLQRYLQRLGFQTEVTELPTDIAGRTEDFKPGKQYNPYFQHRVGDKTIYDAVGGLESYVNYLSNVFYHTDDIQKLRRLSEGLRQKYGTEELRAELDRLNHLQDQLVDEDNGLYYQDIEAMKEEAFNRAGTMTKFGNYVSVLDDYTNILAGKQAKVDRAIESLFGRSVLNVGKNIQNAFSRAAVMGNLSSAINQTVQLPQLVTELGSDVTARAVADVATGKTADFTKQSAFLTGKQGIRSIAEKTKSDKFFDAAAKPFEIVDDFASRVIVRAKYLEQIEAGADHDSAMKTADQYAMKLVGSRMKGAKPVLFEQKNPLSRLATTFQLEVANGWEHIVHDLPMEIQNLAKEKGKTAAVLRTADLIIASQIVNFIANSIIKSITGREPVPFDGLGMMANYLASGYGMTKEDYLAAMADNMAEEWTGERPFGTEWKPGKFDLPTGMESLGQELSEDLPFVGNVTTMFGITDGRLPLPQFWNSKLSSAAGNIGTAMSAETEEERAEAFKKALSNAVGGSIDLAATWLPMGSQAKKTVQGADALLRGGVYSGFGEDAVLQYNVERTPANILRGFLFGKSALPETDEYWAKDRRALSEGQTETYKNLMGAGMSGQDAYDLIYKLRQTTKTEEKSQTLARLDVLQASELNQEQKAEVYYGIIASDKEKSFIDRMSGAGSRGALAEALMELKQVKGSGEGQVDRQRYALVEMDNLTAFEKSMLGQQILGDSRVLDYSSPESLTVSLMSESNRKKAGEALTAGIDAANFLAAYEAQKTAKEDIGLLGKPIKLSEDRNKKSAIDAATPGLTVQQRTVLYRLFDVDSKVWAALPR